MSGRSLAYLSDIAIEEVKGLRGKRGQNLRKGGITSVTELLLHTPRRYIDRSAVLPINEVPLGQEITIIGSVERINLRRARKGLDIVEAAISDGTGSFRAIWFNQRFRSSQLSQGTEAAFSGKLERDRGRLTLKSPTVDVLTSGESLTTGRIVPIHPSVGEVRPGHMRRAIYNALRRSRPIADPIPCEIVDRYGLIARDDALSGIHFPIDISDVHIARHRLVFDELFRLELGLALNKQRTVEKSKGLRHDVDGWFMGGILTLSTLKKLDGDPTLSQRLPGLIELARMMASEARSSHRRKGEADLWEALADSWEAGENPTLSIEKSSPQRPGRVEDLIRQFARSIPFAATSAQIRASIEILADLGSSHSMHRLLQGEVGSGKTLVAIFALLGAVGSGHQGAVMAPTEVLAEQHYLGIANLLEQAGMKPQIRDESADLGMESMFGESGGGVAIALLTSSHAAVNFRPGAARSEVIAWIASGEVDVVVGTHALIQEGVHFAGLGLAIVDEQHRFGVHQRVQLKEKAGDFDPDLLIMTATPIPRTLSMTLYGSLDVSVLDELPPGRIPVETKAVTWSEMDGVYDLIRSETKSGRQVFVVCPLVEESEKVAATSAVTEHGRLTRLLTGLTVGLIHGQMAPGEKEQVMAEVRSGEIDVLVATTVIEVGIDVANASVMVIEDADRFGLSQLHQLRGRVGRGTHPSHCVLVADPTTDEGRARIEAMVATNDGFKLAEEDLRIRGQGTVFGAKQSGMADLRLADILKDADTLVTARREAFRLVESDPELNRHPELREEVRAMLGETVSWLTIS